MWVGVCVCEGGSLDMVDGCKEAVTRGRAHAYNGANDAMHVHAKRGKIACG